ncbi:MAG: HAMP domain-containing protein [Thiohalocapsa sp.]|nr:HAMP domain-containing protein [Thiohalocapsa sp.]
MRFVTKLYLLFGGLLTLAILGTLLALWGTHEARFNLKRTDLAHRSYEAHLSLSNHTYQLFKQFGDAMTIGDRDQGALERELLAAIRRDIVGIREIIASEIRLAGNEEIDELNHLAGIEAQIAKLLEEYQSVLDSGYAIAFTDEWERLSNILDEQVDREFKQQIQIALDEELEELAAQQTLTEHRLRLNQILAILVGVVGAAIALAALWLLVRDLKAPVTRLIEGAEALARGDREHRIESRGTGELDNVALAFNRMADEIAIREQVLEAANQRLERAVAERTAELQRLLDTLKSAENDRRRLLADVSHELRTPLTIIRGEAEIALRGADKTPPEYREALEKTRDAARHTARLVDDLLFIARRESGETRLQRREVDLVSLLPEVIDDCRSMADGRNVQLSFRNRLESALMRGDVDRLRQVMIILLENALRYGGEKVDVQLERHPRGYSIVVDDDGPGLGPEDLARVFNRFFRGSNAARRYSGGAGLGLPVAKAIVEAHDGEIAMQSEPGQGVTVTVMLPDRPHLEAVS